MKSSSESMAAMLSWAGVDVLGETGGGAKLTAAQDVPESVPAEVEAVILLFG